jgi:hypothetical protein
MGLVPLARDTDFNDTFRIDGAWNVNGQPTGPRWHASKLAYRLCSYACISVCFYAHVIEQST